MTDSARDGQLILDERLDTMAAGALRAALLARRGQALVIDAGRVSHLGTLCLQVLLAAARERRTGGQPLRLLCRSPAFEAALTTFGVPIGELEGDPS